MASSADADNLFYREDDGAPTVAEVDVFNTETTLNSIQTFDGSNVSQANQSAGEVLSAIAGGANAVGVTLTSDLASAIRNRDESAAKEIVRRMTANTAEMFHDSMTPVYNWLNRIEDEAFNANAGETVVNKLKGALQRAPGIRDAHLNRFHENHGGKQMFNVVSRLAKKHGMSNETAWLMAGRWLTARYAPQANHRLIQRMSEEIEEFNKFRASRQTLINTNPDNLPDSDLEAMQKELDKAVRANDRQQARLTQMIAEVANPEIQTGSPKVALAAGMNNATARAMQTALEQRFNGSLDLLNELADAVSTVNSYRLALDIESGKADPATVAKFLDRSKDADLLKAMRDLKSAAEVGNRGDAAADAQLDALRKRVADMVKSDYVPLSGHDQSAAEAELFTNNRPLGAPNTHKDYRMMGRKSMPNDGLTTTMAGLISSSTYAGYREFGDNLSKMYSALNDNHRAKYGLMAVDISKSKVDVPQNAVVVRRGGKAVAFHITDDKVFTALRKANIDDTNRLMMLAQAPTRAFGYMATQLNPLFAMKQLVRDTFEKADVLASKTIYDADGRILDSQKLAWQVRAKMLKALLTSWAYDGLLRSALRFAFGRTKDANFHESMLRELRDAGALSTYNSQYKANAKSVVDLISKYGDGRLHKYRRNLAAFVEAYNNTAEYAVSLAVHEVLRENNVTSNHATSLGLDLMNFRKKGTATPVLSMFYAFAQPSMTGGANLINTLYDARRGKIKMSGLVTLGYYTAGLTLLQTLFAALGDDDEGGDKIDQAGQWRLNSSLPIPMPFENTTFDLPLGFGLQRIANNIARGMRGFAQGEKSLSDVVHDTAVEGMVSGVSPIHPSNIDWRKRPWEALLATFSPTVAQPLVAVGTNRSAFDAPIVDKSHPVADLYEWEQYGRNTAPVWKSIAKAVFNGTGIDIAPEEARAIIRGYMPGMPGHIINEAAEYPYRERTGTEVGSHFYSPFNSLTPEMAIRGQFYKFDEQINDLRKEMRLNPQGFSRGGVERKLIAIQDGWNSERGEFENRQKEINKITNDARREREMQSLREDRQTAYRKYVYLYRKAKGLNATDVKGK